MIHITTTDAHIGTSAGMGPEGTIVYDLEEALQLWEERGGYLLLLADGFFVADGTPGNSERTWSRGMAIEIIPDDGASWDAPACAAERITVSEARARCWTPSGFHEWEICRCPECGHHVLDRCTGCGKEEPANPHAEGCSYGT